MSFLKISDPKKRDKIVNDFLKIKKNIQINSLVDRVDDLDSRREYEKIFKPITEKQEKTTEEIKKIEPLAIEAKQEPLAKPLAIEYTKSTNLGPIAIEYMRKFLDKEGVDKVFGIHNKDGQFFIGDKHIILENDDIIIDGERYNGTKGLWELIVSNDPKNFEDEDYHDYVRLLMKTNAMKQPGTNKPKSSKGKKYNQLIKPIWEKQKQITGSGLIDRFDLLMSSKNAGNTGVKNEMISILKKLLNENIINSDEYKILRLKC